MPLDPNALASMIKGILTTVPIGDAPLSTTITTIQNPDGTSTTKAVPVMGPVFMDPKLAEVISNAVATSVVVHFLTAAQVTGSGLAPPGGGPVLVTGKVL